MTFYRETGEFHTSEFLLAAFLVARGVLYLRTEWRTPKQANFIFRQPDEALLLSWQKADDKVSARALNDALNFLRDELRGSRNG